MNDTFEGWVAWMTATLAAGDVDALRCCLDACDAGHNRDYCLDVQAEAVRRLASGAAPVGVHAADEWDHIWLDHGGEA